VLRIFYKQVLTTTYKESHCDKDVKLLTIGTKGLNTKTTTTTTTVLGPFVLRPIEHKNFWMKKLKTFFKYDGTKRNSESKVDDTGNAHRAAIRKRQQNMTNSDT